MADIGRVITTISIWSALVGVLIFSNLDSETVVWVTLIISIAAASSTAAIWNSGQWGNADQQAQAKNKRTNRTSRFVEKMDEDQIVELEELLAARREDRLIDR